MLRGPMCNKPTKQSAARDNNITCFINVQHKFVVQNTDSKTNMCPQSDTEKNMLFSGEGGCILQRTKMKFVNG